MKLVPLVDCGSCHLIHFMIPLWNWKGFYLPLFHGSEESLLFGIHIKYMELIQWKGISKIEKKKVYECFISLDFLWILSQFCSIK